MPLDVVQKPIFLFSIGRSGSTMAQRILAAHERIHVPTSEPHILLPYLYTTRTNGVYAEYGHRGVVRSVEDLYGNMPEGKEEYLFEVRELVLRLYARTAPQGVRYFLDKTPRYHLIVDDIMRLFPEGKFLFLWRNPLAIVASNMDTWAGGRWNLYRYKVDLFDGLENLVEAYREHSSKVCAVHFETLVANPIEEWTRVFDYLELSFEPAILEEFGKVKPQAPPGSRQPMGDHPGIERYSRVSQEPLTKWKQSLSNPARKAWSRRYLRWIGADRLATMGYDLDELLAELDSLPNSSRRLGSDLLHGGYGLISQLLEPAILKHKLQLLPSWHRIHMHR